MENTYYSELRYFDELGDDYIHLTFDDHSEAGAYAQALTYHLNNFYSEEEAKINVFSLNNKYFTPYCISSDIV